MHPPRSHRTALAALAAAFAALLPVGVTGGAHAATFTNVQMPGAGVGEPGVALAPSGKVFVVGPAGTGTIWSGSGSSFSRFSNFDRVSLGSGDTDIAVAPDDGTIYAANLSTSYALSNIVYTSRDGGVSYSGPAHAGTNSDRQWLTAGKNGVSYMSYHDFVPTGGPSIWVLKSTNYGATYLPAGNIVLTDPVALAEGMTLCGNVTDRLHIDPSDPTGNTLYTFFVAGDAVSCGAFSPTAPEVPINQVWMAKSTNGGTTWTTKMISGTLTPGGRSVMHLMPSGAVDQAGNAYVTWGQNTGGTVTHVMMMSSSDGGTTWAGPFQVDQIAANLSNVFPSMDAGVAGRVDIVWYTSTSGNFNSTSSQWVVADARSTNANAATPAFVQSQVSSGIVHKADICQAGLFCSVGGNRRLLDFIDVAIDPAGKANVVWANDNLNSAHDVFVYYGQG